MAQQSGTDTRDERIDADNDDDIRRWAQELGVSNVAIIDAVRKVGPRVADVRLHLDQTMAGGQADA
jgi:hypothetical protein